jgi:hypothetical protein
MNIVINVIEVASELAEVALYEEIKKTIPKEILFSVEDLYEYTDNSFEVQKYKDQYQDLFNQYYDYYFNMISSRAIEVK